MVGLAIVVLLILVAVFADLIAPYDPIVGGDLRTERLLPPSRGAPDRHRRPGRDIFSRIVFGSRITLLVVALVAIIATPIGLLIGTVAGYFGGWIDTILMRITDIFLAFPRLILALAFVAALGPGIENAIIAIAITAWPPYARLARAETLIIRDADYIDADPPAGRLARRASSGATSCRLCLSSVIVRVTLDMAGIILTAAGLGFLGLGAQPPQPEWGAMIAGRPAVHHRLLVGRDHARHRHLRRLARLQPARRRPARRARPEGAAMTAPLLEVEDLRDRLPAPRPAWSRSCAASSFRSAASGSASSARAARASRMTGRAILGLVPAPASVTADRLAFDGIDLRAASPAHLARPARQAHHAW